jgi:hypothetical protein
MIANPGRNCRLWGIWELGAPVGAAAVSARSPRAGLRRAETISPTSAPDHRWPSARAWQPVTVAPPPRLLVTGSPGAGKTTVVGVTVDRLRAAGLTVAGFVTREVREGGRRVGFEVAALDGPAARIAQVGWSSPVRVGRYHVDVAAFEGVALPAVRQALLTGSSRPSRACMYATPQIANTYLPRAPQRAARSAELRYHSTAPGPGRRLARPAACSLPILHARCE